MPSCHIHLNHQGCHDLQPGVDSRGRKGSAPAPRCGAKASSIFNSNGVAAKGWVACLSNSQLACAIGAATPLELSASSRSPTQGRFAPVLPREPTLGWRPEHLWCLSCQHGQTMCPAPGGVRSAIFKLPQRVPTTSLVFDDARVARQSKMDSGDRSFDDPRARDTTCHVSGTASTLCDSLICSRGSTTS
jgi:hypothetical protein